jgi:hypothetical protein
VREIMPNGLAVNEEEDLSAPEDLVRHSEILNTNFQLLEKPVRTKRQKLGKVTDFSYSEALFVQKLYVTRPLHKVLTNEDTLLIDRTQIVEVTDHYILVRDTDIKVAEEDIVPAAAAPAG